MAIKRVLLPIHDDGSFESLASTAFLLGEMFSAEVEGLFIQSEALLVPMFEGPISREEEFFTVGAVQGKRRAIAARVTLCSRLPPSASRVSKPNSTHWSAILRLCSSGTADWPTSPSFAPNISLTGLFGLMCRTRRCSSPVTLCC